MTDSGLRSRSYLAAVEILRGNMGGVLGESALEWNEMGGCVVVGRAPLTDAGVSRLRYHIERVHIVGEDKMGRKKGLQLSEADVFAAARQVAEERSYHPVREYLDGLRWDGHERIGVLPDALGATDRPINRVLIRKWMISAVARARTPGCKVDTMLILVGAQGVGKSTFFRIMGAPWYNDSPIDIHSKDAYMVLRSAWIHELAELETLARARDASAYKAFITSAVDRFRPPWGRLEIEAPRSSVMCGTTNLGEFLNDETGARRFWPVEVAKLDRGWVERWRDQLWAEAAHAHARGEYWWLAAPEERTLGELHERHTATDAWDEPVMDWSRGKQRFSVADVLRQALDKPVGQWSKADEMRAGKVLRRAGFVKFTSSDGFRLWKPAATAT